MCDPMQSRYYPLSNDTIYFNEKIVLDCKHGKYLLIFIILYAIKHAKLDQLSLVPEFIVSIVHVSWLIYLVEFNVPSAH